MQSLNSPEKIKLNGKPKMRTILLSLYKGAVKIIPFRGMKKFYPIRAFRDLLVSHLKSDFAEVGGHRMFLDPKDSLFLSIRGVYEPFETELIKRQIKEGDVVLDLGANIGYYTLIFAKRTGPKGKVFAFEPDPDNFALLGKNIQANGYCNVVAALQAVSNKTEKIKLYLSKDNKGDHRIYDSQDGRPCIDIEAVRLDDYFKNSNQRINFIKMDIQGAEAAAIQGMERLLKKNGNLTVVTEFWPLGIKKSGAEPEEYLQFFQKRGFKLYHINERQKKVEPANLPVLLAAYTVEKGNHTNLLCLKEQ